MAMPIETPTTQTLVARAIAVQLTRRGMTRAALAEALEVGPMWVSSRMTGAVHFDTKDIDRIATVLGLASGVDLLELVSAEAMTA